MLGDIRRIMTLRVIKANDPAIIIETSAGKTLSVPGRLVEGKTAAQLEAEATAWATANDVVLPPFGIHVFEDGHLAIWFGAEPPGWPENPNPENPGLP